MFYKNLSILLYISILTLFILGCSNQKTEIRKSFWSNGNVKEQYKIIITKDNKEIYHGKFESRYLSGRLHKSGTYYKDRKKGLWTTWHDTNTKLKLMQGHFVMGEMNGQWSYWMDHSKHMSHSQHIDHSNHMNHSDTMPYENTTDSTSTHPDPHKIEHYKSGVPHGLFISRYPNGLTADSMYYIDGKIVGKYISYHQNGVIAAIGNYKDGLLEDKLQLWDSLGNKVEIFLNK